MTLQATPEAYRAHGGLGFSAIAEPYMNFGAPGVAVYFFLLALVLVAAYRFDVSRPTRLALWAVVLGPLLWTVRNDFHGFFRPVLLGITSIAAACLFAASWGAHSTTATGWRARRYRNFSGADSAPINRSAASKISCST
jgi:hypothetical protein